ncbi:HDOD domain-containing protein [Desulfobacula sp.]|uniref:HDOD domain-containing protein n=1 Tax=Desulfobacula sp. TaxID=2593537 RepID=UPI0026389146|nr:HDOD domain-containing protein [Desulfobacula sp.]
METPLLKEKTIADSISLEILTSRITLPPIPTNGAKLLDMVQQSTDKIDISSFAKLVEVDPGLLARVLQLANSPYYSEVQEIVSLRSAITRIGLREAINSVCLHFFQKILPKVPALEGFSAKDYWAFSWACATANRRLGHPNLRMGVLPGELYLAGLLHGMGKLLMAMHSPNEFSKCLSMARELNQPLYKMEQEVFGTTDAFVAARIMEVWHLPANICAGVAFYQMPESAPVQYREIAGLTQFAHCIATLSGIGINGDGLLMDLSSTYMGQQSNLLISRKEIQEKLVQEILATLSEKSESVTGVAAISQTKSLEQADLKQERPAKNPLPVTRTDHKKKGLLAWIRSLLGGD